jgi:hypothetical protein
VTVSDIEWRESLPDRCPPDDASEPAGQTLIRLVVGETPGQCEFASHTALGIPCHDDSLLCEWASCSMFLPSYEKHRIKGLLKYRRLKKKTHVAFVQIDKDSGKVQIKDSKHVDLWMFKSFNPVDNIVKVIGVDQYEPS